MDFSNLPNRQKEKRTLTQNNALHKFFALVAQEMNAQGITFNQVVEAMKEGIEMPITADLIKHGIWKPIQNVFLNKKSTTELNKLKDIEEVYDVFNKFISRWGIHVPFPTEEKMFKKVDAELSTSGNLLNSKGDSKIKE